MKRNSLRQSVNDACKQCVYDHCAAGTWKQQVSLCSAVSCPLWNVRPKTISAMPEKVLRWYGVETGDSKSLSDAFE
jgi:hypothetical protein